MRAIRAASAALLGVAAFGLTAPTAIAATDINTTPYDFRVTPSTVAPGGRVALTAGGCPSTTTVTSGVFDTVTIPQNGSTTATVDADARPGAVYSVQFNCIGRIGTIDLTIAGGTARPTVSSTGAPALGVRGGLGGSIDRLNAGEITAGSALVLAAAAGTVIAVRRRNASRQH
ncbi:hypothetical protein [Streptomyces sp. NPDC002889]|uniref:hypothetical protein n=1 Tax=Streptomyces sp. NPDC002889 TaxID=3364669 RepID=UPI0036984697